MNLKSKDTVIKIGEGSDLEIFLKKTSSLDFTRAQQLPSVKHVLSRRWTILQELPMNQGRVTMMKKELAWELWYDWVYSNIPPVAINTIIKKLDKLFSHVDKLLKTAVLKRGATWKKEMETLGTDLDNGFDIRSFQEATNSQMIEEFGIDVGEEENNLYEDNCVPIDGKCPRKIFILGIDPDWKKDAEERQSKLEKKEELAKRKKERILRQQEALNKLKTNNNPIVVEAHDEENILERNNSNEYFKVPAGSEVSKVVKSVIPSVSTRSTPKEDLENNNSDEEKIPQIPVRNSYKNINSDILEVMVNMEAVYSVEQRQVAPLLAYIMNKLAGQSWEVTAEDNADDDSEAEGDREQEEVQKRKRKDTRELTYVLPSRKTMRRKLEDASLMNFKYVAETIQRTNMSGGTVTSGWDDTLKASGHRLHDAKSGRITCVTSGVDSEGNTKKHRQSFTTGFTSNISHKGEDAAISVKSVVGQMAVLCQVQFEEMFDFINFFMNDRAGDSDTMLDSLGVPEEQRLKCNAHPILCVQNSVDKIFKDKEIELGPQKLISTDAGHVFSSPSSSIFTLGLIAFAKFLSPSHAQESISLYKEYKQFLKEDSEDMHSETKDKSEDLLKKSFQKFSSNRFGRVLALAEIFVENRDMIAKFYMEQVDQHANKLFLACYAYLRSPWFNLCCEIGAKLYRSVIVPIKAAIGIDEFRNKSSEHRSWSGLKQFYSNLLSDLSAAAKKTSSMSGSELLEASVAGNVHDGLQNQLHYMKFFSDDLDDSDAFEKIDDAPLTNSGCEANFSQLDLECRRGSGQTKLETMSDRHMVKGNKYFETEQWKLLSSELKRKEWKTARSSKEAKIVRDMKKEFIEKVKAAENLASKEKIRRKQKKTERCFKLLEQVKLHGGPISHADLDIIDKLTDEQLLSEIRYLRHTIAPNIREKRKVGKKFEKFSGEELRNQILNVLKPENECDADIEMLLYESNFEKVTEGNSAEKQIAEAESTIGMVAVMEGPLGERRVGLVLTEDVVQLYHHTRYGFEPDDVTEVSSDWKVVEVLEDYDYITRRTGVYLRCSLSNKEKL